VSLLGVFYVIILNLIIGSNVKFLEIIIHIPYLHKINQPFMKYVFYLLSIAVLFSCSKSVDNPDNIDFTTIFEKSNGTQTPTYDEVIQFYQDLDKAYVSIKTYEVGTTDIGKP